MFYKSVLLKTVILAYIYSISYLYVISFRMQKIPFRFKANTSETNLLFRYFASLIFASFRFEAKWGDTLLLKWVKMADNLFKSCKEALVTCRAGKWYFNSKKKITQCFTKKHYCGALHITPRQQRFRLLFRNTDHEQRRYFTPSFRRADSACWTYTHQQGRTLLLCSGG